ncbi:hypothetical protein LSH36_1205g00086 [Paralvinella palmiformis]|uniref:Proteasome inhibitor PI31 subunit n=1 Tax=Paralvinella palmiformis TaxID=53620 RepID=A0AAD9MR03_9ANNE|nr:hypothetical protein LSH36_1205g00086 [Paralvinella palmiformis]
MAGLEVLFASVQNQLKGAEDAIICCLHWAIISQDIKCIGAGEQIPNDLDNVKKSELLPSGWNDSQDIYTLQYVQEQNKHIYMLKVIKIDEELIVHFMRMKDETVADMMVKISDYSTGNTSSYESSYSNVEELQTKFTKECLDPVILYLGAKKSTTDVNKHSQSSDQGATSNKRPQRHPERPEVPLPPAWHEPDDPFAIGRGDLDPLGPLGGGMVFDPLRVNRPMRGINPNAGLPQPLPPGAVPPGARFDPFGPDTGGGSVPRPYDRRLPGDDYMFM